LECFSEWMRENRRRYADFTEEEKQASRARSYLTVYINRGKVVRPVDEDGVPMVPRWRSYLKPLNVTWVKRGAK
jgi:hypothetical protein